MSLNFVAALATVKNTIPVVMDAGFFIETFPTYLTIRVHKVRPSVECGLLSGHGFKLGEVHVICNGEHGSHSTNLLHGIAQLLRGVIGNLILTFGEMAEEVAHDVPLNLVCSVPFQGFSWSLFTS